MRRFGPIVLGLTGSIGMGKSETARMFRRERVPVFDADAAVHQLMAKGGAAVAVIAAAFPGVVQDGAVDRVALGAQVFRDPLALRRLEAILHPRVRGMEMQFRHRAAMRRLPLVVIDVPLLFETGGEDRCDYVAVVSAPAYIQRARVLQRPGMTAERFAHVLSQQIPDQEKRHRADFIIETGLGKHRALMTVRRIIRSLTKGV
ncbi:dephospho-CoA kinase [Govanella unica]|uniref:Dephospho-CoA kinase n=1 Tax=Govanella unica TaxID=2975056 RepID=A0A9X3Z5N9_9PROT|nr:dephospho-CoA kinase [Govania unica]MDA5192375.1 dephospho-CoA kinase [Govania unica]